MVIVAEVCDRASLAWEGVKDFALPYGFRTASDGHRFSSDGGGPQETDEDRVGQTTFGARSTRHSPDSGADTGIVSLLGRATGVGDYGCPGKQSRGLPTSRRRNWAVYLHQGAPLPSFICRIYHLPVRLARAAPAARRSASGSTADMRCMVPPKKPAFLQVSMSLRAHQIS
jgi:hypothetical protein